LALNIERVKMEKYRINDFLNMTWLRPEKVAWDATSSYLIGNELNNNEKIY